MKNLLPIVAFAMAAGCAGFPGSAGGKGNDVLDIGELARSVWEVKDPPDTDRRASEFAIVEFTLEYVSPDRGGAPPDAAQSIKLELPGILYSGFVETIPSFRRSVVPIAAISDSSAYRELAGTSLAEIDLTAGGAATARFPVDGLLALDDEQPDLNAKLLKVAAEVEAGLTLQVRLRVSVRDGRASIEKGSTFRTVSDRGTTLLVSQRTLVSAERVVAPEEEAAGAVDSRLFAAAMQRLFRPYIGLALIASGRSVD